MTTTRKPRSSRAPSAPKARAKNLTAMAFEFNYLPEPIYTFTELCWTQNAAGLVEQMSDSLKPSKKRLPIRDLRLRVQVRDNGIIGTERNLGTWHDMKGHGMKSRTLAFSHSKPEEASHHANDAIAEWVAQAILKLAKVDEPAAKKLRKLALDGQAVLAHPRQEAVFGWKPTDQSEKSRPFTTLADYVTHLLTGQIVYPGTTPLRRVVRKDLTHEQNSAELMSDVITLPNKKDSTVRFSLGLKISVETYPGRALPIIKIHHKKFVWTQHPTPGKTNLSGYVLPKGDLRALRFEVEKNLRLTEDYAVLATEYSLDLSPKISALDLAEHGLSGHVGPHAVVITHQNGRSQGDVALYGVTDLDRRLSFDRLTEILQPAGFTPWKGLEEIPSPTKSQTEADMAWKVLFEDTGEEGEEEADEVKGKTSENEQRVAEAKFKKWANRVKDNIDAHYGGNYHLVLAFMNGLTKDAKIAQDILKAVLGEDTTIELRVLPANVHGPRHLLEGQNAKPSERAAVRLKSWEPFIAELNEYMAQHPANPVNGVLVLAKKDQYPGRDDVINKRVARIALSKSLGLTVQYLLPRHRKSDGGLVRNAENNYRMRVVNAWRDLAWKSIGKMHGIEHKAQEILGVSGRPVLGVGIIRVNRKRTQGNDASFIPYAIELDPKTGTCVGAVMLGNGKEKPTVTAFMPLPQLIHALTDFGPSYLARSKNKSETNDLRKLYTQQFLEQVFFDRTRLHPELIVLADMATLGGMWPWLADSRLNAKNIILNGESHKEQDYKGATFIRIRKDISPKVIMDTPKTRILINGEIRSSAKRSDADLYRVTDTTPASSIETYLSFGSKISTSLANASSCYQSITEANGKVRGPHTKAWQTPKAIDISIIRPGNLEAEALAKFVEALRSEYAHFGSWSNAPGPLHFASLLKDYVSDYDLEEEDSELGAEDNMPLLLW